jgi:transposase
MTAGSIVNRRRAHKTFYSTKRNKADPEELISSPDLKEREKCRSSNSLDQLLSNDDVKKERKERRRERLKSLRQRRCECVCVCVRQEAQKLSLREEKHHHRGSGA